MKFRRILILSAVGSLTVLYGHTAAQAVGGSAKLSTQTEAWYVTTTSETCSSVDCSMLAPPAEYPKNTLHVGISNGTPTAATYIELDMFSAKIPAGSVFTQGTLTLPVDTAPGDGTLRQNAAELQICQVPDFFSAAKAKVDEPPETDCGTSVIAEYSAEPAPTFTADLASFLASWSPGEAPSLAIMPAPKAEEDSETWHVAFYGKDYEANQNAPVSPEGGTPKPITAKLTYEPEQDDVTTTLPPPPETGFAPPPAPSPPPVSPIDAAPPEPAEIAPVVDAEPPSQAPPEPAPEPVAAPEFITVGYQYPIAWLMPLLLLIGFTMTGHSLTRSLERSGRSLG